MIPSFLKITHKIEMSKRREPLDRLSELPDSLVLSILSFLPMREVVMTTLLSKRFKDLWTTVPCLTFKSDNFDTNESDGEQDDVFDIDRYRSIRFQNFVNRALILWRGTKILKFEIILLYDEWPPFRDLDVWLRFAMENEVEKLNVNLPTDWGPDQGPQFTEYCPPQSLYSCLSIRKIYLAGCKLEINGNVQWDQLKYLKINAVSLSEHVMKQILSGTPQLEVLSLRLAEIFEDLTIHSGSLKALTIKRFTIERDGSNVLTIWTPKLETLEILGDLYGNYVMMNVSSLMNATADIYFVKDIVQISGYKLLEDIMGQVYQTNRHVEKVTLSGWCIEMLGEMKKNEKRVFEPLSNAKFLKLYNCEFEGLMGLLEIFPNLTKLVLEYWGMKLQGIYQIRWGINDPSITKFDTDNIVESQTDFPKSCLLHLTTVEMKWSIRFPRSKYNGSIFQFAEFFLKNAIKLEKLVLRATDIRFVKPELLFSMSAKLLKIPRASPAAEVIFVQ